MRVPVAPSRSAPPAVVCSDSATLEPVPGPRRSTSCLRPTDPSSCSIVTGHSSDEVQGWAAC